MMEPYQELERTWAQFHGLDPAGMVACSSGTAALHLALECLDVPQGASVLVPDFTMIACPRAVSMAGLVPILVDCDDRMLIDLAPVKRTHRELWDTTAVVMPVHIYGRRCDMLAISEFSEHFGLKVVEDLSEIHGVQPHPDTDAACWSFYRNKIVAGEEGGAVYFRTVSKARQARRLRSLGFTEDHDFLHVPRGHNYRLANSLAKLVLESISSFKSSVDERRQSVALFDGSCPLAWKLPARDQPWVYDIRIPDLPSILQDFTVKRLNQEGITTRHGFKPVYVQPEYKDCLRIGSAKSLVLAREVIYFDLTPGRLRPEDPERAFRIIDRVIDRK